MISILFVDKRPKTKLTNRRNGLPFGKHSKFVRCLFLVRATNLDAFQISQNRYTIRMGSHFRMSVNRDSNTRCIENRWQIFDLKLNNLRSVCAPTHPIINEQPIQIEPHDSNAHKNAFKWHFLLELV